MACDPQTLVTATRCLVQGMSGVQLPAAWALLVCSSGPTPPGDDTRILEDGTERDTEDGSPRIIE